MPPRWPRKPDRNDPAYRRLADRINFALHVAIFAAINSGMWFFHTLNPDLLPWVGWFTLSWLAVLVGHAIYIFAIADYSGPVPATPDATPTGDSSKD